MVVTLGQQYNIGEKTTVMLYTYYKINRHAGTPDKMALLQYYYRILFTNLCLRFVMFGGSAWRLLIVCMYVCMYGHTYSKSSMDQPGKVASPARRQLNRENEYFPSAFVPENLASRDGFGSPVPRQPAHLHNTRAESGAYLQDSSRVPRRRPFIHL